MIKDLVYALGYSFFGNAALVMFFAIFVAVTVYVLRTSRTVTEQQANVVLDDLESLRT